MAWMDESMVSNQILELKFVTMGLWNKGIAVVI